MLPFETAEYHRRLQKTKDRMDQEGIEVLLVTDPANINYLSGYDAWSFYVHQLLVVMLEDEQPLWIGRGQDANAARLTTWLDTENIISYADDYVQSSMTHPMNFVAELLHQIGQGKSTIGIEKEAYYFTARGYECLLQSLPDARFQDATLLVNQVRMLKSAQEIAYIRSAASISQKAMRAAVDSIEEGVRECDVAANIYLALISGMEQYGGEYPAIVPLLPSGNRTSTPHITWTDRRYKKGDPVLVELSGCYKRYHAPMARTVVVGPVSQTIYDLSQIVVEGLQRMVDAIRPGMTCEEAENVWSRYMKRYGIDKESRLGYSMGLNYPPDWGEHVASIRQGDDTVLQPNMTFHLIPGIWLSDYGVEVSESILVTEKGCEVLTDFSRELVVKNSFSHLPHMSSLNSPLAGANGAV